MPVGTNNNANSPKMVAKKLEAAIEALTEGLLNDSEDRLYFTINIQLENIRDVLSAALAKIMLDDIAEKEQRDLGLTRLITDHWPYDLVLGCKIIEAEQAYKSL